MTAALRLAFTLLTVAPVRGPAAVDRRLAGRAMLCAPLVGVVLGLLAAGVVFTLRVLVGDGAGPLLPAVGGVATLALLTRGLHLDGLADLADGLGASRDPERSLAVMKRPEVGAFGLSATVLVLLGQVAALSTAVAGHRGTVSVVLAATAGRLAAALACAAGTPAARPGGLGALVAGTLTRGRAAALTVAVAAFAAAAGGLDIHGGNLGESVHALVALAAGLAAGWLLRRYAVRRLGGITGDVLGAVVELITLVVIVAMVSHVPDRIQRAVGLR